MCRRTACTSRHRKDLRPSLPPARRGRAPAILAGLAHRKGAIRAGFDADLVLWDSDREFIVRSEMLQQRHKLTPYNGRTLRGVVHTTYVRGVRVWHEGRLDHAAAGRLL